MRRKEKSDGVYNAITLAKRKKGRLDKPEYMPRAEESVN